MIFLANERNERTGSGEFQQANDTFDALANVRIELIQTIVSQQKRRAFNRPD
jgi:hypothetical protein